MLINNIKRISLTFITLIIFILGAGVTSTFAQTHQQEPLTWGLKAGVNVSDFYGDDVGQTDVRGGFSGGILLNYRFNDYWALQPEVIFNMKGADVSSGLIGENGPVDYEFGYLNVPVLAKFYIPTGSLFSPHLYAGPEVGFKLYGDSNSNDIDDELQDAEFGIAFGTGLDYNLGSDPTDFIRTVGLDLRYSLGLTDVFDTSQEPEARNGVFSAALFLGF
ncbi:Outer membrane protein beta-barrel domain-containing protein [Fodinibius roseus]|uniref:Outer membrane protein beta-barrel domain-containing protein n=1 Tax=Fodinibius roseus TaxID=1194090 RepID=A0A1M5FJ58_9BACT|nr:porin family protein [Fodinibius roseus]SHF91515.1 Outer membrane protein beta-barrel domain-containing protein [Fodinibius roseus]